MQQLTPIYERVPMVWVLVGLLLNATGLWLGFDFTLTFVYMVVGWFCCAFGIAIFVFRKREKPKSTTDTRLSPNFVSAGGPHLMQTNAGADLGAAAQASEAKQGVGQDGDSQSQPAS